MKKGLEQKFRDASSKQGTRTPERGPITTKKDSMDGSRGSQVEIGAARSFRESSSALSWLEGLQLAADDVPDQRLQIVSRRDALAKEGTLLARLGSETISREEIGRDAGI